MGKKVSVLVSLFISSWGDARSASEKSNALVRGNIWLPSPSVFPACSRPISSERSGLWQGGLVTAARSCNTAGAFHISAVNKGNRSRSFSISTAHDLPTCWQRLKGKRGELRPALSRSCTAGWPVTSYSNSQPEKGRKGWRPPEDVCVQCIWRGSALSWLKQKMEKRDVPLDTEGEFWEYESSGVNFFFSVSQI